MKIFVSILLFVIILIAIIIISTTKKPTNVNVRENSAENTLDISARLLEPQPNNCPPVCPACPACPQPICPPYPQPIPGPTPQPSKEPNRNDDAIIQTCAGILDFTEGFYKCLTLNTGVVIGNPIIPQRNNNFNQLISSNYPPSVFNEDANVLKNLVDSFSYTPFPKNGNIIRTTKTGSLYEEKQPIFYDTQYIEVLQILPNYKVYNQNTFIGSWYDYCTGSGCFMKTNVTCMAYNSVHLLHSLGIPSDKIVLYGSTVFNQQLKSSNIENVMSACLDPVRYVQEKWNYCNFESKSMRYLVWMAGQKGYRTIQLSNEWDGEFSRRIFIDIRSFHTFYKNNPFSLTPNPKQYRRLLLDGYRKYNVDNKYIIGPIANTLANPWIFQDECRLAGGSTAIFTNLAQCKKIIRYGTTPELLMAENDPDYSIFLRSNDEEKLRSYFTIVYGNPDIWKNQTLQQLRDRWDCCEVRYIDICAGLKLTLPFAVKRARMQHYHQQTGPQSSIDRNLKIEFKRVLNRCAEQLTYIEVFRQGRLSSTVEDNINFAGTYYYPCRGSGYYLPMGDNWFTQRNKNDLFKTVNMPDMVEPSWEQDKPLASALLAHGVDVMLVTHFMGQSTEVIDSCDVITSLAKLIKTHPFDPIVNQPIEDANLFKYPFPSRPVGKATPTVKKQFNALIDVCA